MNSECNKCLYRHEVDWGTIYVSCGYCKRNKYDERKLIDGHCNKYVQRLTYDCTACKWYDNNTRDCIAITCDFQCNQLSIFDL